MGLETGEYLGNLVATNPTPSDPKSQGDDHLRLIKSALQNSFAGIPGMILVSGTESGTGNAYSVALTGEPTMPTAYTASMTVLFQATHANTGNCTLSVAGIAAAPLLTVDGNQIPSGGILSGAIVAAMYSGSSFYVISPNERAPLTSPAFAGTPTAPTPAVGDNSSKIATTAFAVQLAFAAALPSQTGNAGKFITTNGTSASWAPLIGIDHGFLISNDGTTPNTVLDITAGSRPDSTFTAQITGSAFNKNTTGTWVAGTGNAGMGAGLTIAASMWYHVFAIINSGSYDVYFDTSPTAANAPAGTTAHRYIGSFLTNASAQISPFLQVGNLFTWETPFADLSSGSATTPTLITLSVPSGFSVVPKIQFRQSGSTTAATTIYPGSIPSPAVGINYDLYTYFINGGGGAFFNGLTTTNNSSQVYYSNSVSGAGTDIITHGYFNPRVSPQASE